MHHDDSSHIGQKEGRGGSATADGSSRTMASATSERAPRTMSSTNIMHARRSVPNMVLQSSPQSLQEGAVALPNVPHVVTLSGARVVLWDTAKRRADRLAPDHVQALVSLLVMGSDRQREDVAAILANAACDKANSVEIARAGAIPMLITALTTANPAQPKPKTFVVKVTRALANLAWQNTANQRQMDASGGVGTLVEVLSGRAGDDSDIYEEAAKALSHLMDCSEIAMRVDIENTGEKLNDLAQNGAEPQCGLATLLLAKVACHTVKQEKVIALADVPALIKMLADSSSATTSDQSKRAASVLRKLSHDVKYKSEIVVAGGLSPLIKLLAIGCEKERVDAAWTIGHLAWNAFSEAQIANAGAIPPLVLLVQSENVREREGAVWALRHLSCTSDNRTRISALPEAIPSLVQCVRLAGSDCEREHAIATLKNLACHTENQSSIASAGAMPLLVSILTRGTQGQINQATATLRNLVHKHSKNQAALFKAGGIRALVQLLTTGNETQKINSAGALANVANSTENQCEIVAEGVLAPLLSLTESHHPALLEQVLLLLRNLIWQNEKFQARIGASGVVQRVVETLRGETEGLKKQSAGLVRNLAWHNRTNQDRIAEAQAIPALIALLSSGSSSQRKHAAGAIANLTWNNPTLQTQVSRANGLTALADLTGRGDEKLQAQVTLAIRQFVFGETKKVQAAAPHVIPTFVRMLTSGSVTTHQQQATWALANLACHAANKPEIVSAGGIQPFVDLLSTGSNSQKQYAASALANLASTTEHKSYILAAGGIPPLVELLNRGSEGQKKQAAWAIRNLAWSYVDGQREVADAGGVPALVHLINAGTEAQVEHAAAALANLSTAEVNQSVIGGAGGIEALVKLSKRGTDTQKQQAVWAMANLAMSSGNRATIIELGGVEVLQDLASTGTPGQQKAASAALARINDPTRYTYVTSDAQAVFRPPSDGSEDSDYQRLLSHGALGSRANVLTDTRGSSQGSRELKFGRGLYRSIASVPEIVTRSSPQSDAMQKPTKGSPAYRLLPGARQSEDNGPQRLHLLPSVRETSAVNVEQDQFEWSAHDRDNLPPEHTPLRRIQSANPQVRVAYRMPASPVEQPRPNRPMLHRPSTLGDLLDPYGGYSPAKNQIMPHNVPRVKSDVDLIRSTTSSREDIENIPSNSQHQLRTHNSVADVHTARSGLLGSSRGENSKSRVIDLGSLNEGVAMNELSRRNSSRPPSMERFLESVPTQPPKLRGERSYHSQPSGFDSIGHEEVYEFDEDEDLSPPTQPKSKYPIISL